MGIGGFMAQKTKEEIKVAIAERRFL